MRCNRGVEMRACSPAQVENELSDICSSILGLLDEHLIPTASSGESKVFYLKMKGDYHRYLAEFKTGSDRKEAAEHTLQAYKAAQVWPNFPWILDQFRLLQGPQKDAPVQSLVGILSFTHVLAAGHSPCGPGTHAPNQAGPGTQLLCVLLRNPEFPRTRMSPGKAGGLMSSYMKWVNYICCKRLLVQCASFLAPQAGLLLNL